MRSKSVVLILILAIVLSFVSCEQKIPETPTLESTSATVKGTLDLPRNGSVSGSDVWIKVVCNGETRNISRANSDGTFSVSGLRETESYDILFSTVKPETSNEKSMSKDVSEPSTIGYGGWLSNVTAAINEGNDVGSVSIKPLGTIKGNVKLDGETEHYDILVYIPGTSFSAFTDGDGDFSLYNVPEATYTLRATSLKSDFDSAMSESVTVRGSKTNEDEHPVVQLDDILLYRNTGIVEGTILLDSQDDATGTTVMIRDTEGKRTYTSSTDNAGRFHIDDVKAGTYTLYASRSGFDTAIVEDVVVLPSATKMIPVQTLSSGVRYVNGKVTVEGRTDHSGALVTATNTRETSLIYSAISNEDGDYSLVNMKPGEYRVVITMNNYSTHTVGVVNVLKDTIITLDTANLLVSRGFISGLVRLEGFTNHQGIKVSLLGTDYTTITDSDGSYSFSVPSGNYPGGLRFEYGDFETTSYASTIPVLTNSTYAIPDIQLKCLNVPRVYGKVTIYGLTRAEYDGITVKIAELSSFSYTTDKDGRYSFEHVPVGTYTLEFTRENARKVTKIVAIEPSPYIEIEDIELIPDAVTLYGNISMEGVEDYSGVTVRITTLGSVELKTMTNAAGYWYIGNVVASKGHTITFEKDGWDSQSYDIAADTYEPLALVDYNKEQPVSMKDTTAPVITNISANIGRSTENGREVYLYLYTNEKGSGIKWIQGTTADFFDGVEEQAYYNPFTLLISDEVGEYTLHVRVKDGAGNVSDTMSTNIVVKNDKVQLSGALSGEKLHLTKNEDGKPYVITDNVLVPKGETLVIDPGVEIQIQGAFYIQVEGSINAVGAEDERIKVYGVEDGAGNWKGIKFIGSEESRISYADISGLTDGISGRCDIDHALITANGWAVGYEDKNSSNSYLIGNLENSTINGNVCTGNNLVANNEINGDIVLLYSTNVDGNVFTGRDFISYGCFVYNNIVSSTNVVSEQDIQKYVTYNCCRISLLRNSVALQIQFNNCTFSEFSASVNSSNFIDCGQISITTDRKEQPEFDLTENYWGELNTIELSSKGDNSNVSFINDYYDDFNLSKVIYNEWKNSEVYEVGYHGKESNGTYSSYSIGDIGPAGGLVFYDKGFYSDGWRYLEAASSDIAGYAIFGYFKPDGKTAYVVGTTKAIGSGKYNTQRLVTYMDIDGKAYSSSKEKLVEYAARKCLDYEIKGYDDWFLPSKEELNLMYKNLQKKGLGSFSNDIYWSSSESDSTWASYQLFDYRGHQFENHRDYERCVRAIRAF